VANIRFYEEYPALVPLSAEIKVDGLDNINEESLACGVTILVATSSGSIAVRSARIPRAPCLMGVRAEVFYPGFTGR
jgi:hypothetical protein